MLELSANGYVNITRTGLINHNPSVCKTPSSCYYLFAVYYQYNTSTYQRTSFIVSSTLSSSQSISIESSYKNILMQGNYQYYQLLPGSSDGYAYMDSLIINVETLIGDADLVVSTTTLAP